MGIYNNVIYNIERLVTQHTHSHIKVNGVIECMRKKIRIEDGH